MNRLSYRICFALFALLAVSLVLAAPSHGALSQQQRAQQTVYILVNVTPAPLSYNGSSRHDDGFAISARIALRAKGSEPSVDSDAAMDIGSLVAQSVPQQAVRVQAEVTPNPNATLLVTNQQSIAMSAVAGTTVKQSCAYTVTSNAAAIASWTIRQGLSSDFSTAFTGSNLANDSYLTSATPQPTSTPFVVYPSSWTVMASSGNTKSYCVDLTLTVPKTVPGGAYSTNAVYTLYY
jgi:hypothetical protein